MAHCALGRDNHDVVGAHRLASGLVVGAVKLACQASGRGRGGAATGPAAHRVGVLSTGNVESNRASGCFLDQYHGSIIDL